MTDATTKTAARRNADRLLAELKAGRRPASGRLGRAWDVFKALVTAACVGDLVILDAVLDD